jgi:hypothetical protein
MFAEILGVNRPRQILNELYRVTVRVLHRKAKVPVLILGKRRRDVYTFPCQIVPQLPSISCFEANSDEAIFGFALQLRQNLDVLVVVHFEASQRGSAFALPGLERLCQSDNAGIESASSFQAFDFDRDVGNTSDWGTLGSRLRLS